MVGITSDWIEPDAESSEKKLSGAKALRMQLEWASHMSLQACILPLPQLRGNAHLACILNQVCMIRHDAQICAFAADKSLKSSHYAFLQ